MVFLIFTFLVLSREHLYILLVYYSNLDTEHCRGLAPFSLMTLTMLATVKQIAVLDCLVKPNFKFDFTPSDRLTQIDFQT